LEYFSREFNKRFRFLFPASGAPGVTLVGALALAETENH